MLIRRLSLLLLLCLLPGLLAVGEEAEPLSWVPAGAREALAQAYPDHVLLDGGAAGLTTGQTVLLAVIETDGKKLACVLEEADGQFLLRAENDRIIDDGPYTRERYWIGLRDDEGYGFIWYSDHEQPQREMYLDFSLEPGFAIQSGHFGADGGEDTVGFREQDGIMWVNAGSAIYSRLPHELDLSFSAFDPDAVRAYCQWSWRQVDGGEQLVPTTGQPDALPQGQPIEGFKKGQTIPVYTGPGTHYARAGEGNAAVSTNGWIQVFGQEDGWLMIQYNIAPLRNRFGWIDGKYLPRGVSVPALQFANEPAVVSGWGTEDPLRISVEIYFPENQDGRILATLGERWQYVAFSHNGQPVRAFMPTGSAIGRGQYKGTATVIVEESPLLDDAGAIIGRYYGGARLKVLAQVGERVQVQPADGYTGWLAANDVMLDAAPKDVERQPRAVQICLPDGESERLYTAPREDVPRMFTGNDFTLLGEVHGFAHIKTLYGEGDLEVFCPADWVLTLPEGDLSALYIQRVALKRECAVLLKPEPGANSRLTLYQHSVIEGADLGNGWFLMLDDAVATGASIGWRPTYGYLPMEALAAEPPQQGELQVGLVRPRDDRDLCYLLNQRTGNIDSILAWGARVALLGETQQFYLVRSPGGAYGYLDKDEVAESDYSCAQDAPASLHWGAATLRLPDGAQQVPAYSSPYPNWKPQNGETIADGQPVRVLANLGGWWQLLNTRSTPVFVPSSWLEGAPEAPAYAGIYNAFRDLPFLTDWRLHPPLAIDGERACALLQPTDAPVLAWYASTPAGWAEQSRVPGVLGPDIRLFNGITLQGGVLTLTAYQNDSNVPWAAAFTQADGVWRLSSLTQQAVSDDGNTLLSVRVLRPAEGGYTLEEDGRTAFFAAVLPDDALDSFALKDWAPLLPPVPAQPAP